MAKATKSEMKREALRCMKLLGISEEIQQKFDQDGTVYLSYSASGSARVFSESEMEVVSEVEEEFEREIMIYHVIRNKAFGEDVLTMLTVSQDKDECSCYIEKHTKKTTWADSSATPHSKSNIQSSR